MISGQNSNKLNRSEDTRESHTHAQTHTQKAVMEEKQNAGQAPKDYCMKVVSAAQLITHDITE